MNLFTIISIFVLTLMGNLLNIREVLLFKKDLWKDGLNQSKVDNEYLIRVIISVKSKNHSSFNACYSKNDGYYLKYNAQTYTVVKYCIENYITSNSNTFETHKNFLKIQYLFCVIPDRNHLYFNDSNSSSEFDGFNDEEKCIENIYLTYKWLQRTLECDAAGISLKNNEIELRLFNIMQLFIGFVKVKLVRIDEYLVKLNEKGFNNKIEESKSFNLFYFKDFSECILNFSKYVKALNCFNLDNDSNSDLNSTKNDNVDKDMKTSLKVSEFLDYINNKFYEDHEELKSSQLSLNIVQKNFRLMFEKCLDHIKDRLIHRNVMLPITGDFTINYYC
ncbi:hypothetical protein NBO_359g0001 [Nosema bombycis CQ1]|uniref:Uncharacterized protein n=1 Tax=Nosema bombycis (strain CQ1 / CVCC 102059) TaxID=578461 RepID=R0KRK1_NOSB1|nr:hypothetical protein NBO_359g0001 [Nosema bombycis CQ1]|eukprot:EOB12842.1 hypothetical protein NBO_359g0001 [Nosema bombycis CQ1]